MTRRQQHNSTRICVICGKRTRRGVDGSMESTIGMQTALALIGLSGDKVHPSCFRFAAKAFTYGVLAKPANIGETILSVMERK